VQIHVGIIVQIVVGLVVKIMCLDIPDLKEILHSYFHISGLSSDHFLIRHFGNFWTSSVIIFHPYTVKIKHVAFF
jgi:hypothetical protein